MPLNRSLCIGVDVRGLEVESSLRRGIGRYLCNLLRSLAAISPQNEYRLFGSLAPWQVGHLAPLLEAENVRYITYRPSYADGLDVFLLTDPVPVMTGRTLCEYPLRDLPTATIFYDLIPLAFAPQYLDPNPQLRQEYLEKLEEVKTCARRFLTISRFVADDLCERTGVSRERCVPIMGGLDEVFQRESPATNAIVTLQRFGIDRDYFFYTGGADYRKNLVTLIRAFLMVRQRSKRPIKLVLAGELGANWRSKKSLAEVVEQLGDDLVTLGYVTDAELCDLYTGAVAFVFPSYYEGFGLPALEAMACRCPVIAADGSSLKEIVGEAGILVNPLSADETAAAMMRVFTDSHLAADLRQRGLQRSREYNWRDVAVKTLGSLEEIARPARQPVAPPRRLKVVLQNRPDAFSAPGGDTMVMEHLNRLLSARDVEVSAAAGSPDLSNADVVHLVNLTVSGVAREVAANCVRQKVPFVVTTLFEDWPLYMERSAASIGLFKDYLDHGGDDSRFQRGLQHLRKMPRGPRVGNEDVVREASLLFACAESELRRLTDEYPLVANRIRVAKFGITPAEALTEESIKKVRDALGYESYVLCCGRLETRKNQLMLLKAMEDSDLPIVLAAGGFSYQAAYVDLVRRFPRRGPVQLTGRLAEGTLRTLMAAAAVHVLPSWYELPGLVTLEAASAGTAVVASEWGAIRDYLPEGVIHYCSPDDPDSIREAIENALAAGPNPLARTTAESYTWDAFGDATLAGYEEVLTRRTPTTQKPRQQVESSEQVEYKETEVVMNRADSPAPTFEASIIIPVHNRAQLTQECMEALSNCADRTTYEVIVVDNHSTDDTPRLLQAIDGDVTILRQPSNRGFAPACNAGARMAQGEFLIFLNNDTRVQSGWLDALVDHARSFASIGVVGSKLIYPDGDVQHAGLAFHDGGIPYHIFQHFAADHPAVNEARDMQAVTGACMLVKSELFRELGGFDEGYRNGFEDVDFCLRAIKKLRRVAYCPASVVIHHEEASEGRKDCDRENLNRFLARWGKEVRTDENEILSRFGYTIDWQPGHGTYRKLSERPAAAETASLESARAHYAAGELEAAAAELKTIVESKMVLGHDDEFETWQTLGNCLTRLNRLDEAENAYHEARRADERSERPYLGLGTVAMLGENWQAAMYGFMAALSKNPETTRGEFGVGLSLAARSRHAEAIEHFQRVLRKEPANTEALFYLYRSAMESSEPRLAVAPLQTYLENHPNDVNFLFNLCGAYWKSGDLPRAVSACQKVLALDPEHAAAKDVLENLRTSLLQHA